MIDFIRSVLHLIDGFNSNGDLTECIWWRTDDEYKPVTFFVTCNDLFYWACADSEKLTPENLPMLTQAISDVRVADGVPLDFDDKRPVLPEYMKQHWNNWYHSGSLGAELFCARVRKMRPQQPCYKTWSPAVKALFDACGPERNRKDEG